MILPFRLFHRNRAAASDEWRGLAAEIEVHEERVLEVCKAVASDVLPMFGENKRMTDTGLFNRAVLGYARPLAAVLRHVDFSTDKERAARVSRALLVGATDLATKQCSFTPPALELVIASSYNLAYPGGVDLFQILPDIYIRPSLRGDAAGFARTVDNMDLYWNDALEGLRLSDLLRSLENGTSNSSPGPEFIQQLKDDRADPCLSHYRRQMTKRAEEWRREEGDKSPKWSRLCRYWMEARGSVRIPAIDDA